MSPVEIDIFKIILESGLVVKSVFIVLCSMFNYLLEYHFKEKEIPVSVEGNDLEFLDVFNQSKSLKEIMYKAELMDFSPSKAIFVEGYNELNKILDVSDRSHFNTYGF